MERIEIVTSVERRRHYTSAEKGRLVAASLEPGARVVEVARSAGIDPSLLYRWRRAAQKGSEREAGEPPTFIPVTIAMTSEAPPSPLPGGMVTVEFTGGARLRIEGAPDAATLENIIGSLLRGERRR